MAKRSKKRTLKPKFAGPLGLRNPLFPTWSHLNDNELEIARIVDQIDLEDRLTLSSIQEVVTKVDFMMNGSDGEFLTSYVQWRMEHPIVK